MGRRKCCAIEPCQNASAIVVRTESWSAKTSASSAYVSTEPSATGDALPSPPSTTRHSASSTATRSKRSR